MNITDANYKKQIILAILMVTFINFSQLSIVEHMNTYYAVGLSIKISCFTFLIFYWVSLFAGGYNFKKKEFLSSNIFKWALIGSFSYVAMRFTNDLSEELLVDCSLKNTRLWINALFSQAVMGIMMFFVLMGINYLIEGIINYFKSKWKK